MLITVPAFGDTVRAAMAKTAVTELVTIGQAPDTPELADLMGDPLSHQVAVDFDAHTVVLPYSSGTTGLPKGVMLSHRNLVTNCPIDHRGVNFRRGEVAPAFLPFFHIYGMTVMMNLHLRAAAAS